MIDFWIAFYGIWIRLFYDDSEIRALRNCRNQDLKRLELVERALREDGKL
jgi:hypothetical protein